MGLSIHYRGVLRALANIPALIAEVEDIAESLDWRCRSLDDARCIGVVVSPEDCEPVVLCFYPDTGALRAPWEWVEEDGKEHWQSTKTQYAGMDAHIAVIKLLRYLSEKYFARFELHDEGQYWETESVDVLRRKWAEYEVALDFVADAFEEFEAHPGESAKGLVGRIEQLWRKRIDNKEEE